MLRSYKRQSTAPLLLCHSARLADPAVLLHGARRLGICCSLRQCHTQVVVLQAEGLEQCAAARAARVPCALQQLPLAGVPQHWPKSARRTSLIDDRLRVCEKRTVLLEAVL